MTNSNLRECSFPVPIRRDKRLSDGQLHSTLAWDWLEGELWERFRGWTRSEALVVGVYPDEETGRPVRDRSRTYTVAVRDEDVDSLRNLLKEAKDVFYQECFYLNIGGQVELV
jgi:hypothetical protein